VRLQPGGGPFLLRPDDRGDPGIDRDGARGAVDLGLLAAEPAVSAPGPAADCGPGASGSSGSASSIRISLIRRPGLACSIMILIACGSSSPPAAALSPGMPVPAMIGVIAASPMMSRAGSRRPGRGSSRVRQNPACPAPGSRHPGLPAAAAASFPLPCMNR